MQPTPRFPVPAVRRLPPPGDASAGEHCRVAGERLIAGDPRQTSWMLYTDASGKFCAGYWRSEPGKWRVAYTEEEFCELLEGCSILTADSGHAVTLHAGDRFVVPAGFTGTWEVVATTLKLFVIYEAGA